MEWKICLEKKMNEWNRKKIEDPRTMGQFQRVLICITGIQAGKEKEGRGRNISNNAPKFCKIGDRHKITHPGSLENTKKNTYQIIHTYHFQIA